MTTGARFDYVAFDNQAKEHQKTFKEMFETMESHMGLYLRDGRSKSIALTKLEETYMWVGKAIRDDQVELDRNAP